MPALRAQSGRDPVRRERVLTQTLIISMKIKVAWIGKTKEAGDRGSDQRVSETHLALRRHCRPRPERRSRNLIAGRRKDSATSSFSSIRAENNFPPKNWPSFWSASS